MALTSKLSHLHISGENQKPKQCLDDPHVREAILNLTIPVSVATSNLKLNDCLDYNSYIGTPPSDDPSVPEAPLQHERVEAEKLFASKEAEEEAKREPVKTFTLGKLQNDPEDPMEEQAPSVVAPTPAQIIAIKAAIVNSQTLEEVARLEQALRSGQLPADLKFPDHDMATDVSTQDDKMDVDGHKETSGLVEDGKNEHRNAAVEQVAETNPCHEGSSLNVTSKNSPNYAQLRELRLQAYERLTKEIEKEYEGLTQEECIQHILDFYADDEEEEEEEEEEDWSTFDEDMAEEREDVGV